MTDSDGNSRVQTDLVHAATTVGLSDACATQHVTVRQALNIRVDLVLPLRRSSNHWNLVGESGMLCCAGDRAWRYHRHRTDSISIYLAELFPQAGLTPSLNDPLRAPTTKDGIRNPQESVMFVRWSA